MDGQSVSHYALSLGEGALQLLRAAVLRSLLALAQFAVLQFRSGKMISTQMYAAYARDKKGFWNVVLSACSKPSRVDRCECPRRKPHKLRQPGNRGSRGYKSEAILIFSYQSTATQATRAPDGLK